MTTPKQFYAFVDTSASMSWDFEGRDPSDQRFSGPSRIDAVREVAIGIVSAIVSPNPQTGRAYDPDGIGIGFFGNKKLIFEDNQCSSAMVRNFFDSNACWGSTPTHLALQKMVDDFVGQQSDYVPHFGFLFTDGAPDDLKACIEQLKRASDFMAKRQLPDPYFCVLFVMVGNDLKGREAVAALNGNDGSNGGKKDTRVKDYCNGFDLVASMDFDTLEASLDVTIEGAIAS